MRKQADRMITNLLYMYLFYSGYNMLSDYQPVELRTEQSIGLSDYRTNLQSNKRTVGLYFE